MIICPCVRRFGDSAVFARLFTASRLLAVTPPPDQMRQPVLISTAHVIWDPEFCDVKLIQSLMLMSELKNFVEKSQQSFRPGASKMDLSTMPMILCGDLNSLPDSGTSAVSRIVSFALNKCP